MQGWKGGIIFKRQMDYNFYIQVSLTRLLSLLLSCFCQQIVFEGIKGTSGVVALDDIEYTVGVNCANKVTDPLTSKMGQWFCMFFQPTNC